MSDEKYAGYVDKDYLKTLSSMVAPVKKLTYELMNLAPGRRVIDIGCGPGIDTIAMGTVSPDTMVFGVDRDPVMVRNAQLSKKCSNVEHAVADAMNLPFADASFDACRSERLLQHCADPASVVREFMRVLVPGGKIVLIDTDHSTLSIDTRYIDIEWKFRSWYTRRLANGTSGRQLYRLLKENGASQVTVRTMSFNQHSFAMLQLVTGFDTVLNEAVGNGCLSAEEATLFRNDLLVSEKNGTLCVTLTLEIADGVRT